MAVVLSSGIARVSDDDLVRLSVDNPGWRFERSDEGELELSLADSTGGKKSAEACGQLRDYARKAGGDVFDSSTGFTMPKGGVRSPDAAWLSDDRAAGLSAEQRTKFWRVVPDVVVEVVSDTDDAEQVRAKIDFYSATGAVYAVSIDPFTREIYERGTPPLDLHLEFDAIIDA